MSNAVIVCSGGLDSVTLLHHMHTKYPSTDLHVLSFDYGQRHKKELQFAEYHSQSLGATHNIVNISSITSFLAAGGSSLVSSEEVPEGHYAQDNMKATVVPNRNMIMTSIAVGHAVAIGAEWVALGVHAGDHFIYPDCRPRFFRALNDAVVTGNAGFGSIPEENACPIDFLVTPFITWTKEDIARRAGQLDIDVSLTWSCYKGGDAHCGRCGTCVERLEAVHGAGISDYTYYLDTEYWKTATAS